MCCNRQQKSHRTRRRCRARIYHGPAACPAAECAVGSRVSTAPCAPAAGSTQQQGRTVRLKLGRRDTASGRCVVGAAPRRWLWSYPGWLQSGTRRLAARVAPLRTWGARARVSCGATWFGWCVGSWALAPGAVRSFGKRRGRVNCINRTHAHVPPPTLPPSVPAPRSGHHVRVRAQQGD